MQKGGNDADRADDFVNLLVTPIKLNMGMAAFRVQLQDKKGGLFCWGRMTVARGKVRITL